MDQRISIITLGVADLDISRQFYEALGWKTNSKKDGIIAFNLLGMALALYPREDFSKDATVAVAYNGHPPFSIAYNVDNEASVDQTLLEAKQAGGTIIKPGQKVFWGGYSGYFADPDGFLWEVTHNPFSPLGPDGAFQWGGSE